MKPPTQYFGDIFQLRVSYQSIVILLPDKHSYIDLIYLDFIRYSYTFRLSTSAILGRVAQLI